MSDSGILAYCHCRRCTESHRRARLSIGLVSPITLRIWCATCNSIVRDFTLATPMEATCGHCGERITEGHVH